MLVTTNEHRHHACCVTRLAGLFNVRRNTRQTLGGCGNPILGCGNPILGCDHLRLFEVRVKLPILGRDHLRLFESRVWSRVWLHCSPFASLPFSTSTSTSTKICAHLRCRLVVASAQIRPPRRPCPRRRLCWVLARCAAFVPSSRASMRSLFRDLPAWMTAHVHISCNVTIFTVLYTSARTLPNTECGRGRECVATCPCARPAHARHRPECNVCLSAYAINVSAHTDVRMSFASCSYLC
jgi:hypothetical protein